MKKTLLYVCAGVLALGLSACGKGTGGESGSQSDSQEESSSGETSAQVSGDASQDTLPEEGSATDAGQEQTEGWSEEMTKLRAAVVEAVGEEEYWPDMPMEADMLETFYGITSDLYEDYMAESPMISANVDTLLIVKAKEDQADAVVEILSGYRENLVGDTMQYPQNLGKIQASQVEKIGNYVIFVQLGGSAIESDDAEAVLAACQEANRLALDAIRSNVEG